MASRVRPAGSRAMYWRKSYLLVFEQDFRGESERQPPIKESAQNGIKRLPSAKDLEEDTGVKAYRHA